MFPVLLAEEDCSIKRGQPSITRDLPKSSSLSHKHVVVVVVVFPFLSVVLLCRPWNQIMCHSTSISGLILCSVINRGDERL